MLSGKLQLVSLIKKKIPGLSWKEAVICLYEVKKRNGGKLIGLKLSKFMSLISSIESERKRRTTEVTQMRRKSCPVCFKMFATKYSCMTHQKIIHFKTLKTSKIEGSNFKCSVCGLVYAHQVSLKRHTQQIHDSKSERFKCDDCIKTFGRKDNLWRHRVKVHKLLNIDIEYLNSKSSNRCSMCRMVFKNKDLLLTHLSLQACFVKISDDEKYQCEMCDKSYIYKSDLNRHRNKKH